jgi:hypothetical protein
MEKFNKRNISNIINERTFNKKNNPNISNSSDITHNNYYNSTDIIKNKSLRKNILKQEMKKDSIKKENNIMNFSTDKIVVENTINNNDIKYVFENSSNSYFNNFGTTRGYSESNKILENYIIRLKNFGFPELGDIKLSSDITEQEKTFSFLDYLITKETNNLERNNIKEKEKEEQILKNKNLENKISLLTEKLNSKEKKLLDLDKKIQEQKDFYENKIDELTKDNQYLTFISNKITLKKKNLEFKLYSLNKTMNKFENMKSNIINAVEAIDHVQNNDMEKMLIRVKNTEKLIESLKCEYNESLRELSFQVSSFRNLIFEIYNEICVILEKPYNIENYIYNLPFLELMNHLKKLFKKSLELLKERVCMNDIEDLI